MSATSSAVPRDPGTMQGILRSSAAAQVPLVGGFLLLLVVAAATVWLVVSSHRFNESVAHTLVVRSTAYRLLTLIQDAETGERGFILTGNKDYLRPYETGRLEAPRALGELQDVVADNEIQSATIGRLRAAMSAKLADLALTVGLTANGDRDAALKHVKLNIGNDIMQQVRVQVAEIESEEERREDAQSAAAEASNRLLAGVSILGILVVFALAGYAITTTRRATRALLQAQDDLHHTNENLEAIVAERVRELQLANDEIQRFAYIVSHDLRAPLVNVMGFTSELETARGEIAGLLEQVEQQAPQLVTQDRRTAIETDLPEALGFIRTSTAKMDRLINAILKLSREGRRVLTPQTIDLHALVESQGESLSQQLAAGRAELSVQDDLPPIVSDRLAVEQIFGNLIENAIKNLSPQRPGLIRVTGRKDGVYLRYDIADNGRGIDAKDFERIFELFRRSGEQDKPGEGIGLAYVRNLARRLGGNVAVESELGAGSTFIVTLPAVFAAKKKVA